MKKIKYMLKSNRVTRPVYMILYYLYWYGVEAALRKVKEKMTKRSKPAGLSYVQNISADKNDEENHVSGTKLYIEEFVDSINSYCNRNYLIDKLPDTATIKNGIILPFSSLPNQKYSFAGGAGGVCYPDGSFAAGHIRNFSQKDNPYDDNSDTCRAYAVPEEVEDVHETVVYGGLYIDAYGHIITECLSRLWWYVENTNCNHKCVFISNSQHFGDKFIEFLDLLGIPKENIILCKNATRFDNVIIPDQAFYFIGGYTEKAKMIYNNIRDSVQRGPYEKVYLTKSKFPGNDIINEEYFENFYRSLGFVVISPECLTIKEQISVLAGAKHLVCMLGTLGHQIAFCQDGINLTILKKVKYPIFTQYWMNQLRNTYCTFIDVSNNFLPHTPTGAGSLCVPTIHWKQYLHDNDILLQCDDFDLNSVVVKYIELWAKNVAGFVYIPELLQFMNKFTLANVIIGINEGLSNEKLDENVKKILHRTFSKS